MVRAKKKNSISNIRAVWSQVSASTWITTLNSFNAHGKWSEKQPGVILGCCPWHKETTPSFYIFTNKGYAKCFGGSCGKFVKDPSKLLQKITGYVPRRVHSDIMMKSWGVKFQGGYTKELQAFSEMQEAKDALFTEMQQHLLNAVKILGGTDEKAKERYDYCEAAIKYLKARNVPLTAAWIRRLGIGLMPTWRHLHALIQTKATPYPPEIEGRVKEYLGQNYVGTNPDHVFTYTGSVAFCYRTDPDDIGRIKLRFPSMRPENKKFTFLGTKMEKIGVYGLDAFRYQVDKIKRVYTVEGEFDQLALTIAEFKKTNALPEFVVLATGGGGIDSIGLEFLHKDLSFEQVASLGDNDKGGTGFTRHIFERVGEVNACAFDWAKSSFQSHKHCDPDELVTKGHYEAFRAEFMSEDFLQSRHDWVFTQIGLEIAGTQDVAEQEDILQRYSDALPTLTDRRVVIDQLLDNEVVPKALIYSTLMVTSSEDKYIALCRQQLAELMVPMMQDDNNRVTCYSIPKKQNFVVTIDRNQSLLDCLSLRVLDKSVYEWCRQKLGEPDWLLYTMVGKEKYERSYKDRCNLVHTLFVAAAKGILVDNVAHSTAVRRFGQGVHHFAYYPFAKDQGLENTVYVVNGQSVYRTEIDPESERAWFEKLDIPRDGLFSFDGSPIPWSRAIKSVKDLNECFMEKSGMTPRQLYDEIVEYIDVGWTFSKIPEVQKMECEFIAALILYAVVSAAFPYMHQSFFSALFSSGKSSLLLGVLCNNLFGGEITLVEHAQGWTNYTPAGLRGAMQGTSLMVCLDEFEDPDTPGLDREQAENTRKCLSLIRGNITGGVPVIRGTQTGGLVQYFARAPVIAAGIHPPRNEADVSRWNFIFSTKIEGQKDSPLTRVINAFSEERRRALRQGVTLLPLQQLPQIFRAYERVRKYETRTDLPDGVENRSLAAMSPVISILEWVGYDSFKWTCDYLSYKKSKVREERPQEKDTVLSDILETPNVRLDTDLGVVTRTVGSILYDQSTRENINHSYCGVYFLRGAGNGQSLVVFYLPQILSQLLKSHAKYRGASQIGVLKKKLLQNHTIQKVSSKRLSRIVRSLQPYVGTAQIRREGVLVARFEDIIADVAIPEHLQESTDDNPM